MFYHYTKIIKCSGGPMCPPLAHRFITTVNETLTEVLLRATLSLTFETVI